MILRELNGVLVVKHDELQEPTYDAVVDSSCVVGVTAEECAAFIFPRVYTVLGNVSVLPIAVQGISDHKIFRVSQGATLRGYVVLTQSGHYYASGIGMKDSLAEAIAALLQSSMIGSLTTTLNALKA